MGMFFHLLLLSSFRLLFVKVRGPFVPEVVQEVQPVHQTCGKCVWSGHSGVWSLHISAGQSGESEQALLIGSFFQPLPPLINPTLCSFQDAVNQIMETNLWLRHVSSLCPFSRVMSGATLFRNDTCMGFRSGMTTNWDGSLLSMMGLNTYGFHLIRFGGQILFCTTSKLKFYTSHVILVSECWRFPQDTWYFGVFSISWHFYINVVWAFKWNDIYIL